MKLVTFLDGGTAKYGAVVDGGIAVAEPHFLQKWPTTEALLQAEGLAELSGAMAGAGATHALDSVELLPPLVAPAKILCVGLNYKTHVEETGRETPTHPMLFARYPDSVVGHNQPLIRPKVSERFDFEGELAVVIGRTGRHISKENAYDYVAGYACFNEGSIRDYQRHTIQFTPGKTFWRSGSFGPWLVTADDVPNPADLDLETRLNGQVMQSANTSDLLFDIPTLIEYISQIFPVAPGDVIVTGTTGGVGHARKPPVWMKPGDTVEVEISGIGTLTNTVEDER